MVQLRKSLTVTSLTAVGCRALFCLCEQLPSEHNSQGTAPHELSRALMTSGLLPLSYVQTIPRSTRAYAEFYLQSNTYYHLEDNFFSPEARTEQKGVGPCIHTYKGLPKSGP